MKNYKCWAVVTLFSCLFIPRVGFCADETEKKSADKKTTDKNAERKKAILGAFDDKEGNKKPPQETEKKAELNEEVGNQITDLFNELDNNADGKLTQQEFRKLPKHLGPAGQFIKRSIPKMYFKYDKNRNGTISKEEFQNGAESTLKRFGFGGKKGNKKPAKKVVSQAEKNEALVKKTIKKLDKNKDGLISKKEGRRDKKLKKLFAKIDANLDEMLSSKELTNFLNETTTKKRSKK